MNIKLKFLSLYFILAFSASVFAGIENADPKTIAIKDIKIIGNKKVSEFQIRENILIKEKEYEIAEFSGLLEKSLKVLHATNFFKNVSFKMDEKDSQTIYLYVDENQVFDEFEITGLHNAKSGKDDTETIDKVKDMIDYRRGDFIDDNKTFKIKEKIKMFLKSEGYYYADVKTDINIVDEKHNRVKLVFDIFEGAEIKVKFVNLYSREKMKKLKKTIMHYKMKTDKGDIYKPAEFEEDINKIKLSVWNEGFMNAKIHHEFVDYKTENKIGINIYIERGKKYYIKDYAISGNVNFSTEKISKQIKITKGQLFNYNDFSESVKNIQDIYAEEGYIETKVDPEQIPIGDNEVKFDFKISEGNKIYIDKIIITGNYKTREKVITRELLVKSGDVMNTKKIDLSRRNLVMLNFFDNVDIKIEEGSKPLHKNLIFQVEEGRTGTLSLGAGYSSVDKFVGFVEVTKNNFDLNDFWSFTGKGQKVNARIEYGKDRQNFELGWSDPWFNDNLNDTAKPSPKSPLFLGYNIYRLTRNPDDYDIQRTGGNIKLGRKLGYYNRGFLKYQFEQVKIYNVLLPDSGSTSDIWEEVKDLPGNQKKELQSSITLELNRNTTDSVKWPTNGYIINHTNEISGGIIGGDVDYWKSEIDASLFFPMVNTKLGRQVLALHCSAGSVKNIFSSGDVPSYEKYFLGGSTTIRGYSERSIKFISYSSTDTSTYTEGGKTHAYFNLEYRIPLVKDTISAVLFYDGGTLHRQPFRFQKDDWRFGYGFGFRISTPMGDLRLDWARRVNDTIPGSNDKGRTEIHFNIGNMF